VRKGKTPFAKGGLGGFKENLLCRTQVGRESKKAKKKNFHETEGENPMGGDGSV